MICPKCGREGEHSWAFDAVICRSCDLWVEERCEDAHCWAGCARRPDRPSQIGEVKPTANERDDSRHFLARLLSRSDATPEQRATILAKIALIGQKGAPTTV